MIDICIATYNTAKNALDRLAQEIQMHTPQAYAIHIFSNDENAFSLVAIKNDLARQGSRTYIAFLNPDVHLESDWAGKMIEELEATPNASCIVPRGIVVASLASEKDDPLSFFAVLMRRSTFEALQGFDERFRFNGADADFRKRIGVIERGDVIQSKSVAVTHNKGLELYRAIAKGAFSLEAEKNHRDVIRNRISDGTIKMWHELSQEERDSIRKNPAYLISGPVIP